MVPRAHEWELEQKPFGGGATGVLIVLRVLAVFREYLLLPAVFTGSTLWVLGVFQVVRIIVLPSTACSRGSVLLALSVLSVFGPSVLLILQVLSEYLDCQYCNTLSTRCMKKLDTLSILGASVKHCKHGLVASIMLDACNKHA